MPEVEQEPLKIVLESLLLTSTETLGLSDMQQALSVPVETEALLRALDALAEDWRNRGLELVRVADGWRFQTRATFAVYRQRLLAEKPPRYSRAVMETLAVIAWRQPATRGDIEAIRGVTVSASILRILEERGWIRSNGQRQVPGRPALYITTPQFLQDFGLRTLDDLPLTAPADKSSGGAALWVNRELDLQGQGAANTSVDVVSTAETDTVPYAAL